LVGQVASGFSDVERRRLYALLVKIPRARPQVAHEKQIRGVHLLGMFAFAIAERDSGRVLLGRDRLGIKPLYLTEDAHRVRFASSLTALPAGGDVDTRIDPIALHHYLTFHSVVPPPRTILRGVTKVPPASLVAIEPDGAEPRRRIGNPTSPGARSGPSGPNVIGRMRFSRRCAWRWSDAWWPTCPSGACCRAESTPA
jgi:asparagine synthetase B (glutamine-hydrolysing)